MLKVLFLRHGETGLNKDNRFRGFTDVPLNQSGVQDAKRLSKEYGSSVSRVYTSDLKRASETAHIVANKQVPVQELKDLRPWDIGNFAGTEKTKANKAKLQQYADSGQAPPGGETIRDFGKRFKNALKVISANRKPVAVVMHASNMHELSKIIHGNMDTLDVEPGGAVEVTVSDSGRTSARILDGASKESQTVS